MSATDGRGGTQRPGCLIIRTGAIGDVIMALPMIPALARLHPGCTATWVVGQAALPVLAWIDQPDLRLDAVAVDENALYAGGWDRLREIRRITSLLAGRRFALGLNGHTHPWFRLLGIRAQVGVWRSWSLRGRPMPMPGRHHSQEYLRLATGIDGPELPAPEYPALRLPAPRTLEPGCWIGLCPGGGRNIARVDALRRWPMGHWRELAERLVAHGCRILLLGGAGDRELTRSLVGPDILDLVGETDLDGSVAALRSCRVAVANDAGLLHLADLAGTPTIALFGPTNPAEKAGIRPTSQALVAEPRLPCMPCYDGISYADCPDNRCLAAVSPARAAAAVLSQLDTIERISP